MSGADLLLVHAHLATMGPGGPYGQVSDGVLAIRGDSILYAGPAGEAPAGLEVSGTKTIDVRGAWVTPGLIDCHTHLVFGGNRAKEFERRLGGASYEEIARQGGGILSTVRHTRASSDEELLEGARNRVETLLRNGVTTVEIKSGYGLDVETELRMLRVAGTLSDRIGVVRTVLAAHALPPEASGDRDAYVTEVCLEVVRRAAEEGLADAVDGFLERIAFTADECRRVLQAGAERGLAVRLHADQLSDGGGAALAASLGARSADHLEYTSDAGARAMGKAGTVAVLLPGAFYFLGETRKPPVASFRAAGVPMAVATDLNPGSSPLQSPLLAMNMACVLFGLTPEEALAGMTVHAARVLGLEGRRGVLAADAEADLVVWDVAHPSELCYWMGSSPARHVIRAGRLVHTRE